MRRRLERSERAAPPARLLEFDVADWLPLVDVLAYDSDCYRNRADGVPYGEPTLSLQDWQHQEALTLWARARLDWCRQHGWPDGLDSVDLLRQTLAVRRAMHTQRHSRDLR